MALVFSLFAGFVSGVELIEATADAQNSSSQRVMTVTSDGHLHYIFTENSALYYKQSTNDGVTWSSAVKINGTGTYSGYMIVSDSDDYLYILYYVVSGADKDIRYNISWDDGVSWNDGAAATGYGQLNSPAGFSCLDVVVGSDDNVYLIYSITSGGNYKLYARRYTKISHTWSSSLELYDHATSSVVDVTAEYCNNGTLFIAFITSANDVCYIMYCNTDLSGHSTYHNIMGAGQITWDWYRLCSVKTLLNNIFIAFIYNNNAVHLYEIDSGGNILNLTQVYYDSGYATSYISLSYSTNGYLHILSQKGDVLLTNEGIHYSQYRISSATISDEGFLDYGNDDKNYPFVIYQRYPSTCMLTNGYVGCYYNDTQNEEIYIDDGTLVWYTMGLPGGSGPGDTEICDLCSIGGVKPVTGFAHFVPNSGYSMDFAGRYMVKDSYTIDRIDAAITKANVSVVNAINNETVWGVLMENMIRSHVELKVNEFYLGYPDDVYGIDQTLYAVWDDLPLILENTEIYYCLHFYPVQYVLLPYADYDLNQDGALDCIISRYIWDGFNGDYENIYLYTGGAQQGQEPIIRFCTNCQESGDENFHDGYINGLWTSVNALCNYEPIDVTWEILTANFMNFECTLVSVSPTLVTNTYHLLQQSGHKLYYPNEAGTWTFNLTAGGVVIKSRQVTVTDCGYANELWTDPNPSSPSEGFTVHYVYNGSDVGNIRLMDNNYNLVRSWEILEDNETGSFFVSGVTSGCYILELRELVRTNASNRYLIRKSLQHNIQSGIDNSILCLPDNIEVYYQLYITGVHSHVGQDVRIRIGGQYIDKGFVGCQENFRISYNPSESGTFTVSLVLVLHNSTRVLANTTLTVTGQIQSTLDLPGADIGSIVLSLPFELRITLGLFICLLVTFTPFIIGLRLKQWRSNINIPTILYVISFSVAVIVCWIYNFWEWQITFFLMFMVITVYAFMYMYNKGSSIGTKGSEE